MNAEAAVSGGLWPDVDAHPERRAKLIEVAAEEFLDKGFEAASIDGIARRAGVAKHTIYRNFGSKEELLRVSLLRHWRDVYQRLEHLLDIDADISETLTGVARYLSEAYSTPRSLALARLLIAQKGKVTEIDEIIERINGLVRFPLFDYLARLDARGSLRIPDVQVATVQFINLCTLGPYFLLDGDAKAARTNGMLDAIVSSAVRIFVAGHRVD